MKFDGCLQLRVKSKRPYYSACKGNFFNLVIFQSDKGIGLDNTDFSQLGAMAGMYQQPGSPSSPVVSRFTPSNQSYLTWGHLFLAIISNGRLSQSETQSATLPHIRGPTFGPLQPRGAYLAAKRLPFAQYAIPATL